MSNITPVILLRSVNINRGGITKAAIKRANLYAQTYKNVVIITTIFQPKHKKVVKELYKRKELSEKVTVLNFFEDMRSERGKRILSYRKKHRIKEEGYVEFHVPEHAGLSYRYYKDGFYRMYKRFNKKSLSFIDYMDNSGVREIREEYDENGYLVRKRYMDRNINKPRFDQYIDYKGNCFLSVHVNPESNENGITVYFGKKTKTYNKLYDLQSIWLNNVLNKFKRPVVFSELRGLDEMLTKVTHPNIKKVAVTHSSHLTVPFDDITKVKPSYRNLFSNDKFDKYVFLTQTQKKDVESVFGNNNKYTIISHSYEIKKEKKANAVKRDNLLAISLVRYVKDKRIHETIHAFKYVVDRLPDAKLFIFGMGPLKEELQSLIDKLKLENNVFLNEYTTNLTQVYQSAACSILTSRREGFGMVMTESMAQGTPVVAYDFKYGPKDIIQNGINGFVVENGNRQELAEKVIKIMTNHELRETLSENAIKVRNTFSDSKYSEEWLKLIKSI